MPRGVYERLPRSPAPRFLAKFAQGSPDECWNWAGAKAGNGYGHLRIDQKSVCAHRFSYEYFVGKIPDGLVIDHLCRNPSCVNPAHLEAVSMGENTARGNLNAVRAAKSAAITHCKRGHLFSGDNVGFDHRGHRFCKTCQSANISNWKIRNRDRINTMQRIRRDKAKVARQKTERQTLATYMAVIGEK